MSDPSERLAEAARKLMGCAYGEYPLHSEMVDDALSAFDSDRGRREAERDLIQWAMDHRDINHATDCGCVLCNLVAAVRAYRELA